MTAERAPDLDDYDALEEFANPDCQTCDGAGWTDDPTACGDRDHCTSWAILCPVCIVGVWT